jgi:uncharacterized protein
MTNDRDWFEEGLKLFNAGRFFDCHEAWEQAWKHADGDAKVFFQGLIQAAVAILHVQRGNSAGAASVYQKAHERLDRFPDEFMGLAVGDLRRDLSAFFAAASISGASRAPVAPTIERAARGIR